MISALLVVLLIVCILFSALFSASETGILSVNRIRLRHLVEKGDVRARMVDRALNYPQEFFSTNLVGNNLVLVIASTICTYLGIQYFGEVGSTIGGIVLTILILTFGEIIPKTLFRQYADELTYRFMPVLGALGRFLRPLVFIFVKILEVFTHKEKRGRSPFVTREEMHHLVIEGEKSGALESHERDMIHSIFSFAKTHVQEVMTPLTDAVVIDKDASAKELISIAKEHGYTRIPVFDDRVENIVGVVNVYEFLYSQKKRWQDAIRPVLFVPHTKRVGLLIKELQRRHEQMCIVINEHGDSAGLVTMEDLMEEIVGDISGDAEEETGSIKKLSANSYRVMGKCSIEEINNELGLSLSTDGFETVSGYIFHRMGRVPKMGEVVKGLSFSMTIEKMDKNRIISVKVVVKE